MTRSGEWIPDDCPIDLDQAHSPALPSIPIVYDTRQTVSPYPRKVGLFLRR